MPSKINIHDLLQLASIPGIGTNRLRNLVAYFQTPSDVLKATPRDLVRVEGIDKKLATTIAHHSGGKTFADDQLSRLNKLNGKIITVWDDDYPVLLKKIYDPPVFLFIRGSLQQEDRFSVAIVGTRHPTTYGKAMTEKFAQELSRLGIIIVSGLARGIDTLAHRSALHSGGRTLCVIGSGIDHIYPAENKKIVEEIEGDGTGAVVSEFFMGTKPDPGNFPRRNRIISGMTLGTLIVESDAAGGAMITASTALDQNRELFCIPGNIGERKSIGTNTLIRQGQAKLVQSVEDIVEELEVSLRPIIKTKSPAIPIPQLSIFEQKIFDVLSPEPVHIDVLSERSSLSPSDTLVNLLSLEFKGVVRQLAGKMFLKM